VLDALPVGVAATDVTGRVVVNRVARRRRGLPTDGEVTAAELEQAIRSQVVTVLEPVLHVLGEQDQPTRRALAGLDTDLTATVATVSTRPVAPTQPGSSSASPPVSAACAGDTSPTPTTATGSASPFRLAVMGRLLRDPAGRVMGSVVVDQDLTGVHETNLLMRQAHRDTDLVAEAVRAILRCRDGKAAITHAARVITSAGVVALFEPDGHGDLVCSHATGPALTGLRVPSRGPGVLAGCYSAGQPVWSDDIHADPRTDQQLHAAVEAALGVRLTSGAWYPITTNGRCLGVLVIACPAGVPTPRTCAPTLELLATETALALAHKQLLIETERLSNSDPLTGAANRRAWELAMARELPRALRQQRPLSMLLIDLDHFKAFNDAHGTRRRRQPPPPRRPDMEQPATPRRPALPLGREKFAVLLPDCDLHGATIVADDLRTLTPGTSTCSIGIAEWDHRESHHDLAARADTHLYTAKTTGRDRIHAGTTP
jgi:GGDEF domain-containing protein